MLHLELAKLGQGVLLGNGSLPRNSKIPKLRHGAICQFTESESVFRVPWEMLDHWTVASHLLLGETPSTAATASNCDHLPGSFQEIEEDSTDISFPQVISPIPQCSTDVLLN